MVVKKKGRNLAYPCVGFWKNLEQNKHDNLPDMLKAETPSRHTEQGHASAHKNFPDFTQDDGTFLLRVFLLPVATTNIDKFMKNKKK